MPDEIVINVGGENESDNAPPEPPQNGISVEALRLIEEAAALRESLGALRNEIAALVNRLDAHEQATAAGFIELRALIDLAEEAAENAEELAEAAAEAASEKAEEFEEVPSEEPANVAEAEAAEPEPVIPDEPEKRKRVFIKL